MTPYYDTLGVTRDATLREIKAAYRKLAKELHPDRNPGDAEAEARFKKVNDAYAVLGNPKSRTLYDSGVDPLASGVQRSQHRSQHRGGSTEDSQAGDGPSEDDVWPSPSDPMAVARALIGRIFHDRRLWWRGSFYRYTGTYWAEVADPTIRSRIYRTLEYGYSVMVSGGVPVLVPWKPTRSKIANVMDALTAVVHIPEHVDPPAWLRGEDHGRVVSMHNGLLQVQTGTLLSHTTALFNLMALPYDYDPGAPEPGRWLKFLKELWPDDPDSIALLQEFFGYVVSGETDLHKILLLIGPPRSGKGTIARVLTALIGSDNVAGPTLASLGQNFGLSPLLGKSLAVVSDARLGDKGHTVVERLLAISGEDAITVDRKYKEPWTGRLGIRFLVISNELPSLGDASGAVATRFVVLTLSQSWLGHENKRLTTELLAELPAILNWSLDGLDRLHGREHFTEPATSRDAVTVMNDLASPVGAFVRDRCERGPGHEIPMVTLFGAWKHWCDENGHKSGTTQRFGRNLRAVVPTVKTTRPRVVRDGPQPNALWADFGENEETPVQERERHYVGIALKPVGGAERVLPR